MRLIGENISNMETISLRKLNMTDEKAFTEYLKELVVSSGVVKGVALLDGLSFVDLLAYYKRAENIPFVDYNQEEFPFYQYILVRSSDNKIVGAVNVRPFLNKQLNENFEGNIGYSVNPSERGKGYGKKALSLAIEEFKKLNPNDKIIICCYRENIASRKIIESFGGKLIEDCEGILTPQKYEIDFKKV